MNGKDGADGRDGSPGRDGKDGECGAEGAAGKDGADGRDGERGADGTPGRDGKDGHDGNDGLPGRDGVDGKDGRDGKDGFNGKDGDRGLDGRDGAAGRDGRDGVDGRDAADIEVLPSIDFGRSYPRGTFASHLGGLWRAHANTDDRYGWSCIVEGIAALAIERDGERGFVVAVTRSGGAVERAGFAFPVLIYRGTYVPERLYEPGDTVTWAGSLWHCNAPTSEKPDAGGGGWTLIAKRGRDGKDARVRERETV
ncbi:collagen-like domain-containing protein [Paraburkholderia tropica]|uniref:hypothetical protein n=1 Tax=Paraburkholderia tropica TaxID=92647 RepID=UPI002AB6B673|nr:hypothetical protein [Paraburkholderia tropica]